MDSALIPGLMNGALTVLRALLKLLVFPFPHVLLELRIPAPNPAMVESSVWRFTNVVVSLVSALYAC